VSHRARSRRDLGLSVAVAVAVLMVAMSVFVGRAGQGATPVAATNVSAVREASNAQAAQCVTAANWEHSFGNRAWLILIFTFARGSNNYLGLILDRSSVREGPTGTWTKVDSCGPGTTTTTVPGTTTTTRPATTTTTRPTTTTTRPGTTTTTAPAPDGAAIYAANCAVCHGADGSGGVGPDLRGIGQMHTLDQLIEVITNGRGGMPAWRNTLSAAQIRAVATYVSQIPGEGHEHDHPA
jgi:mono/diheme cytochrome c family protein